VRSIMGAPSVRINRGRLRPASRIGPGRSLAGGARGVQRAEMPVGSDAREMRHRTMSPRSTEKAPGSFKRGSGPGPRAPRGLEQPALRTEDGTGGASFHTPDWFWFAVVPALLAIIAYLPSLRGGFVSDDKTFLLNSPIYREPGFWRLALTRPFVMVTDYFRPLALLSFMVDLRLWGVRPLPLHLTNVILLGFNTFLVGWLALGYAQRPAGQEGRPVSWWAAGVALLYGLHPALVEATAWISGRFDLLVTFWLLLGLAVDLHWRTRTVGRALLVGILFFLAALSKEMAVVFLPVLLVLHHASARPDRGRGRWLTYGAILLAGLISLLMRRHALGALYHPIPGTLTGGQHLLLILRSWGDYTRVILIPFGALTPTQHYTHLPLAFGSTAVLTGGAALLLLLAGALLLIKRRHASGAWLLAALIALLPVVNIVLYAKPIDNGAIAGTIGERFTAFPLALIVIGLAPGLAGIEWAGMRTRFARMTAALLSLWLLACLVTVQLAIPHWRDEMRLWSWGVERSPDSSAIRVNLSRAYSERGDFLGVIRQADAAIRLGTTDFAAWNNRGAALENLGRWTEAEQTYREGLRLRPDAPSLWTNLGAVLGRQGKMAEAEEALLQHALKLDPNSGLAQGNLGLLYLQTGRAREAIGPLERALRLLAPGSREQQVVRENLELARRRAG
jgi:protein O-mannosyl-transferase